MRASTHIRMQHLPMFERYIRNYDYDPESFLSPPGSFRNQLIILSTYNGTGNQAIFDVFICKTLSTSILWKMEEEIHRQTGSVEVLIGEVFQSSVCAQDPG